jgi:hypothetical protein
MGSGSVSEKNSYGSTTLLFYIDFASVSYAFVLLGGEPFKCSECNMSYAERRRLVRHIKMQHTQVPKKLTLIFFQSTRIYYYVQVKFVLEIYEEICQWAYLSLDSVLWIWIRKDPKLFG